MSLRFLSTPVQPKSELKSIDVRATMNGSTGNESATKSSDQVGDDLLSRSDRFVEENETHAESGLNAEVVRNGISLPTLHYRGSEHFLIPTRHRIESEVTVRIRNQRNRLSITEGQSDPNKRRWLVLVLTCLLMSGIYYSLDIPAALHQQLKDYMPQSVDFETKFNLLFTLYSLPNIILPFLGGYFVDRLGASWCLMCFVAFCFIGQFTFAIGMYHKMWSLMYVGRTLYGLGGESISVAYSTLLSKWFAGKEVALAFGVALAVSRMGSVVNNLISPYAANHFSVVWAVGIGIAFNFISLMVSCFLDHVDGRSQAPTRPDTPLVSNELSEPLLAPDENDDEEEPLIQPQQNDNSNECSLALREAFRFGPIFWLIAVSCSVVYGCVMPFNNIASGILLERNYFKAPPADCQLRYPDQCSFGSLQNGTNPSIDSLNNTCPVRGFAPVVPISINMTGRYKRDHLTATDIDCTQNFWSAGCTKDYCDALSRATETTGKVMSIPYFFAAGMSPLLGHIVDRVGHRAFISMFASLMLIGVHTTMALSDFSPVLPLIGQGTAYALFAAVIWPSVPLVVEKRLTGTAFGVMTSIQNMGQTVFPMMVATVYNKSEHEYIPNVEFFFVACAALGSICGFALFLLDCRTGQKLHSVSVVNTSGEDIADDHF